MQLNKSNNIIIINKSVSSNLNYLWSSDKLLGVDRLKFDGVSVHLIALCGVRAPDSDAAIYMIAIIQSSHLNECFFMWQV